MIRFVVDCLWSISEVDCRRCLATFATNKIPVYDLVEELVLLVMFSALCTLLMIMTGLQ